MSIDHFNPYEDEAAERWGGTGAYRQSAARTSQYTEDDWKRLGAEADAINTALVHLMTTGMAPESEEAMQLAEQHREHISTWFYECPLQMHAALGRMYVADPRFTASIDRAGKGLAAYLSAAIGANSRRPR
jgi:hypothetical protein